MTLKRFMSYFRDQDASLAGWAWIDVAEQDILNCLGDQETQSHADGVCEGFAEAAQPPHGYVSISGPLVYYWS